MAVYISGKEVGDRLTRILDRVRALRADRLAIDRYAEDLEQEGVNASTIQTDINAKLVDWGSVRDEIVGDLNDLPLYWKARVKIGMSALYNSANIEANFANNLLADLSTAAVIRANSSSELTSISGGPFSVFLADDVVEISNAENASNNKRLKVRYSTAPGGIDLITNGGFASATGWTEASADIGITGGVAVFANATATLSQAEADMVNAGAASATSVGWIAATYYLCTFDVLENGSISGSLAVGTNTTPAQHTVTAVGTHRALILGDNNAAGLVFTATAFTGGLDNVSLIPFSGLAFYDELGTDNAADTKLVITLQER